LSLGAASRASRGHEKRPAVAAAVETRKERRVTLIEF
jgi:hypothetical protein